MNFKLWFILSETLDASTKGALEKYQAPPDELAAFIKELEDNPNLIDRKAAFAKLAERFPPTKQKPTKQEDGRIKLYQDKLNANQITKPEFDTFMLFIGESNKDLVTQAMNLLRRFIENDIITLEVKNNKIYVTKDNETKEFNDFTRFESELHSIEASLTKYEQKSGVFNPIIGENKYRNNLAAKGENVWVFKGDAPDLCRIFGKSQIWCISSSKSATHWFNYRIRFHQTQYFVFDFNKDESDPARYVNPGVAPKGMYSEWVDARNEHSTDPENRESQIGINGYTSINQYKRYLASKGIPESIWTTTEPEVWEKDLKHYIQSGYFGYAKKDSDPRVFPMYLRIANNIGDDDFDSLTEEQKKEFVLGKLEMLTDKQLEFAKNIRGYYNSLNLDQKVDFAGKTKNQDLIAELAKNQELSGDNVYYLMSATNDIDKIVKILGQDNINKVESINIFQLLSHASDIHKMAKILGKENIDKIPESYIYHLLLTSKDKYEMAEILGSYNISKLDDPTVTDLLQIPDHNEVDSAYKLAMIIIKYKKELSSSNVFACLRVETNIDNQNKIIEALGSENINKLFIRHVYFLLNSRNIDINRMAEILGSKNIDRLDKDDIFELLYRDGPQHQHEEKEVRKIMIDKMSKILGSKNIDKLDKDNIFVLLDQNASELEQMAEILGSHNINKLSTGNVVNLLINSKSKNNTPLIIRVLGPENINKLNNKVIKDHIKRNGINLD
jgi:hypothetical protein